MYSPSYPKIKSILCALFFLSIISCTKEFTRTSSPQQDGLEAAKKIESIDLSTIQVHELDKKILESAKLAPFRQGKSPFLAIRKSTSLGAADLSDDITFYPTIRLLDAQGEARMDLWSRSHGPSLSKPEGAVVFEKTQHGGEMIPVFQNNDVFDSSTASSLTILDLGVQTKQHPPRIYSCDFLSNLEYNCGPYIIEIRSILHTATTLGAVLVAKPNKASPENSLVEPPSGFQLAAESSTPKNIEVAQYLKSCGEKLGFTPFSQLPDHTQNKLNGWKQEMNLQGASGDLAVEQEKDGTMYLYEDSGVKCYYIHRFDPKDLSEPFGGVICFKENSCDACFIDRLRIPRLDFTIDDLLTPIQKGAPKSDCHSCHSHGTTALTPKFKDYAEAHWLFGHQGLNATCAENGVNWYTGSEHIVMKNKKDPIATPSDCADCHISKWRPQDNSVFFKRAFDKDRGAMLGNTISDQDECYDFLKAVGADSPDMKKKVCANITKQELNLTVRYSPQTAYTSAETERTEVKIRVSNQSKDQIECKLDYPTSSHEDCSGYFEKGSPLTLAIEGSGNINWQESRIRCEGPIDQQTSFFHRIGADRTVEIKDWQQLDFIHCSFFFDSFSKSVVGSIETTNGDEASGFGFISGNDAESQMLCGSSGPNGCETSAIPIKMSFTGEVDKDYEIKGWKGCSTISKDKTNCIVDFSAGHRNDDDHPIVLIVEKKKPIVDNCFLSNSNTIGVREILDHAPIKTVHTSHTEPYTTIDFAGGKSIRIGEKPFTAKISASAGKRSFRLSDYETSSVSIRGLFYNYSYSPDIEFSSGFGLRNSAYIGNNSKRGYHSKIDRSILKQYTGPTTTDSGDPAVVDLKKYAYWDDYALTIDYVSLEVTLSLDESNMLSMIYKTKANYTTKNYTSDIPPTRYFIPDPVGNYDSETLSKSYSETITIRNISASSLRCKSLNIKSIGFDSLDVEVSLD